MCLTPQLLTSKSKNETLLQTLLLYTHALSNRFSTEIPCQWQNQPMKIPTKTWQQVETYCQLKPVYIHTTIH